MFNATIYGVLTRLQLEKHMLVTTYTDKVLEKL